MATPVLNVSQDKRKKVWFIDELYFGNLTGNELWRPNIGDAVIDFAVGMYKVIAVSADGIPTLDLINRFSYQSNFNLDSTSLITSVSQYNPSIANRIFMYEDVTPNKLTVDGHFLMFGSEPSYMVFFVGTDVTDQAAICSEVYDGSGIYQGNEVPLEVIEIGNNTVKRPVTFSTTKTLSDGEVISFVAYKSDGGVYTSGTFRVVKSNALRPSGLTTKSITGIYLKSEMLDTTDKTLILNRVGVPIDTQLFSAVLTYDDSSEVKIAIDGSKTKLVGLDQFDASYVGDPTNLLLSYSPSPSEPYINGGGSLSNPVITKSYKLANIASVNSYNLKVFMTTFWDPNTNTYSYKWYLINLEGDVFIDVTDKVTVSYTNAGAAATGKELQVELIALVSLNMNDVAPVAYPNYIHTQSIIFRSGIPLTDTYTTLLSYNQRSSTYGDNVYAVADNTAKTLDISMYTTPLGFTSTDYATWLNTMYTSLEPQYDNTVLSAAPDATGFEITFNGETTGVLPVTSWNTLLDLSAFTAQPTQLDTVEVVWHRQTANGDLIMAIAPLFVRT